MIKRYDIIGTCGGNCHEIEADEHGDYVRFEDHEAALFAAALSKEQQEAIASSIRSLRYAAHPHRSPHADELIKQFPSIKL